MFLVDGMPTKGEVNAMTDAKLLNEYISSSGLKISYICKEIGLSRQGFANKINNKKGCEFKVSEILSLCKLLNIPNRDLRTIFFSAGVDK